MFTVKKLARAGIVGALYIVLSLIVFPIASGQIQFRISEGLTLLPLFLPESTIGLFVGCMLSNLITGASIYDIFLGSLITLVASFCTYFCGKIIRNYTIQIVVGGLFPVLLNAFLLPLIWTIIAPLKDGYFVAVIFLLLGQTVSVYLVGTLICLAYRKIPERYLK